MRAGTKGLLTSRSHRPCTEGAYRLVGLPGVPQVLAGMRKVPREQWGLVVESSSWRKRGLTWPLKKDEAFTEWPMARRLWNVEAGRLRAFGCGSREQRACSKEGSLGG